MSAHPYFAREHPIAFSHRGGRELWPENTMEAFQNSYALGYRYYETDLQVSADGVIVCMHDTTLDRTTNGTGPVRQRTWSQMAKLDAGYRFMPVQNFPFRSKGVGVPRLDEVLSAFPDAAFTLELKAGGFALELKKVIEAAGAWDRILIGALKDGWTSAFKKVAGRPVLASAGRIGVATALAASRIGRPVPGSFDALQIPPRHSGMTLVDEKMVAAAHEGGKQLHVWTINTPEEMKRLLALGVDGVMTDRPDLLKDVMVDAGSGGPW